MPAEAVAGNPAQETQTQSSEVDLVAERKKLDDYRDQLLRAYNKIKDNADLFDALKEEGIKSKDDLAAFKEKIGKADSKDDNVVPLKDELDSDEPDRYEELEKKVSDLQRLVQDQNYHLTHNKYMSDVKNAVKDSDEFVLLKKLMEDPNQGAQVVNNILRNMDAYQKQNGKPMDLKDALKEMENHSRVLFKSMGGQIEDKPAQTPNQFPPVGGDLSKLGPPPDSPGMSATDLPRKTLSAPPGPQPQKPEYFDLRADVAKAKHEMGITD